ncbi:helix-turn-helix domain-containing protein [Streptomyces sp. NPDC058476]|uniref:AlbA family DNA-binding domain-containing protein n=1 Tax=Streptomyces sp. NPDC058476 TaxID=3346519 RepID=UPI00365D901A
MALPARLTAALGRRPDDLTEADLQRAVENHIPEGVDLDWKKDFYKGTEAGKKELAKDVSAMANTAGGMVVIGVDDGDQDHARALAPFDPVQGHGEEWIRSVLANWIQPVVPNVGVRPVKSASEVGKIYWVLTVPPSTQAPHAVAAPGNDYHFRVHVRHGTTTRTLAESEIAQRSRDRFQAAFDDVDRLHQVADAGLDYLSGYLISTAHGGSPKVTYYPGWVSLAAVPAVRGAYPVTTRADRDAAFDAHAPSAGRITVHPTPAASDTTLALDILAALGKPTELPGTGGSIGQPAWILAAAWILSLPDVRLTVLRAHLLDEASWSHLLTLRMRTGMHLVAVCHTRRPPAVMRTALRPLRHHTVSTDHGLGDLLAPAPTAPAPPSRAAEGRWITVPALAYLASHHTFPRCSCTRPRPPTPTYPNAPTASTRSPTAWPPAPPIPSSPGPWPPPSSPAPPSPSSTPSVPATSTPTPPPLTLHDPRRTRRPGFTADCGIYTVPTWARPFLLAAANLVHLSPRGDDRLFTTGTPRALPYLTDFAEHCRLRPPQPAPPWPRPRTRRKKRAGAPEVQWYDGISSSRFEYISYEQWLHTAASAPPPRRRAP